MAGPTPLMQSSKLMDFFIMSVIVACLKRKLREEAIADVSAKSDVNVNLLTHLEYARVKYLVKSGKTFT